MLRTGVHLELLAHGATERVLRQHALHGMLDDALRMLGHGLFEGLGLQPAGETAVAVVALRLGLRARHADLVRVDDDHEVAGVDVRRVLRLVLALENLSAWQRRDREPGSQRRSRPIRAQLRWASRNTSSLSSSKNPVLPRRAGRVSVACWRLER